MLRLLGVLLLGLMPSAGFALCEARDMIDDMPDEARASLEARAAATPYAEGIYWRAERDDTAITLFGTYHFQHDQTQAHLDLLKPRIKAADVVYLEMSNDEQENFQNSVVQDPSLMFMMTGPGLPDLLGDDWTKFSQEMTIRGFPTNAAARLKPLWAAIMLSIGPCEAQNGAMSGKGIDALIGAYASENGVPSKSLEDFKVILRMLDDEPMEKQIEMIRLSLNYPGNPDDMSYTIRERYLDEEIALTWEFTRDISLEFGGETAADDFAKLEDVMLTQRNIEWVDVLSGLEDAREVFVAFGAGHLPGQNGVLRLLEKDGFTITRLALPK